MIRFATKRTNFHRKKILQNEVVICAWQDELVGTFATTDPYLPLPTPTYLSTNGLLLKMLNFQDDSKPPKYLQLSATTERQFIQVK